MVSAILANFCLPSELNSIQTFEKFILTKRRCFATNNKETPKLFSAATCTIACRANLITCSSSIIIERNNRYLGSFARPSSPLVELQPQRVFQINWSTKRISICFLSHSKLGFSFIKVLETFSLRHL